MVPECFEPTASRRSWIRGAMLAAVPALVFAGVGSAEDAREPSGRLELRRERNLLTVRVDKAPFSAVLEELARATGLQVRCEGGCEVPVSAFVTGLTPEDAVRALLSSTSHVLLFEDGREGRAATMRVLILAETPASEPGAVPGGAALHSALSNELSRGESGGGEAAGASADRPAAGDDAFAEEHREDQAEQALLMSLDDQAGADWAAGGIFEDGERGDPLGPGPESATGKK